MATPRLTAIDTAKNFAGLAAVWLNASEYFL